MQITPEFDLWRAAGIVDYLRRLGADWVYCSPLLQAEPGSRHGYDVVDHSRTDAARGGRAGLAALATAAHDAQLGVLADIVPNHVGVATPPVSVWWWDVLAHGQESAYAQYFDIDWEAGAGRVLIPVLGDGPEESAALRVEDDRLCYYEHAFPIAEGTAGGSPREVHARQHYRLVNFRRADTDLNYRRFFAVNTLAAIRPERREVFDAAHGEIAHWLRAGWVDGLRVDHPDGLADPAAYLRDLAHLAEGRYTVVEKILQPGEELPANWDCAGTTGYETLALIDRVLVDPAGQDTLDRLDHALRGEPVDWQDMVRRRKRAVADGILQSDVRRLVRALTDVPFLDSVPDDAARDAVAELLACFGVYRTYLPHGTEQIQSALDEAHRRRPDLAETLDPIGTAATDVGSAFSVRLQQTSGAVMAKGVEDCAFYRYPRLVSLTEVGGDPAQFAVSTAHFHAAQAHRLATWPDSMTTLSTHDTKRGEDVRARIDTLSEVAEEWAAAVTGWLDRAAFRDRVLGHLLLQTAFGAWPVDRERMQAYADKAAREAGDSTGWIDPDTEFEAEMHRMVDALYDEPVISREFTAFVDRLRPAGWSNSLAAKVIQLTLPGVPDVYRGTELWEDSLVDPDNRRPFDPLAPGGAADLLGRLDSGWLPDVDESGAAKLLVTSRSLRARRDRPELFQQYRPLNTDGPAAGHLIAFDRGGAVTLATRLPTGLAAGGGWGRTTVTLPAADWTDVLTGTRWPARGATDGGARADAAGVTDAEFTMPVSDVLARYPVALLLRS